jgi:hypothetical protein
MPMVLNNSGTGGPGGAAAAMVTGLAPGTTYYFRLRASNYDGQSPALDLGPVTTLSIATPEKPLARVLDNGHVVLTWTDVLPVGTKVSILRSTNGMPYTETAQVNSLVGGGVNTYTDTTASFSGSVYRYRLQAVGGPGGTSSPFIDVPFTVIRQLFRPVDYAAGFPTPPSGGEGRLYEGPSMDLLLNGNINSISAGLPAVVDDDGDGTGVLRLTDLNPAGGQASAVWSYDKVEIVGNWMTQFDFRLSAGAAADGFTFALQNDSNTFVGSAGGGGGYSGVGANAVGIGFDTWPAISATGAFIGNGSPISNDETNDPYVPGLGTNRGLNLNPGNAGVDLKSGHNLRAVISYDGTNLSEMVIDLDDSSRAVFNYNYGPINLAQVLGGAVAWVGFTAGTGGDFEQVDIQNWVFSAGHIDPPPPPDFIVNDGSPQRSLVKSLSLKFSSPNITIAPGALRLIRDVVDVSGNVIETRDISTILNSPTPAEGGQSWTWTFIPSSGTDTQANGSLTDGVFHVVLDATKVTNGAQMGSNYTSPKFHRLFGDVNGSKYVNASDFNPFRRTFGKRTADAGFDAAFDFNGDGTINALDYNQFRRRFGNGLIYS